MHKIGVIDTSLVRPLANILVRIKSSGLLDDPYSNS